MLDEQKKKEDEALKEKQIQEAKTKADKQIAKDKLVLASKKLAAEQENKDRIPAIVHEDGTCRIQTIKEGKLSTLLKEYDKLSGDPVLLNTSFNDNGKPIIETPEDALEGLINMNIDYLVIGNTIVKKT